MAIGDFTPTRLAEIQLKMDEFWKEPQYSKAYSANGETAKAVMENQTATFAPLEDPEKLKDVSVNWVEFCDTDVTETQAADQCPMDAPCPEGESKSVNYALDIFLEKCYSVNEDKLEDNIFSPEDVIAKGLMNVQKSMIEAFNKKVIAKLVANLGVNPYVDEEYGVYNPATGFTEIEKDKFNFESFYPYLAMILALNKSDNVYMIDGGNLYRQAMLARAYALNDDGKTDQALFELYALYQDIFGFAATGNSASTFVIDKGAVAIATRAKYPVTPRWIGGTVQQTRYQIPLEQLPGVALDVAYAPVCSNDQIVHKWNFKLRAGVFVNPLICDTDNTGILGFKKVPNIVI